MSAKLGVFTVLAFLVILNTEAGQRVKVKHGRLPGNRKLTRAKLFRTLGVDSDMTLLPQKSFVTIRGSPKVKFHLSYHGIPIYDASIVAELSNGGYTGWAVGEQVRGLNVDLNGYVKARLRPEEAIKVCRRKHRHVGDEIQRPHAELYIHPGRQNKNQVKYRLVYIVKYLVLSADKQTSPLCIVDANRGRVEDSWENLKKQAVFHQYPNSHAHNSVGGTTKVGVGQYTFSSVYGSKYPPLEVSANSARTLCSLSTASKGVLTYDFNQNWYWPYYPKEFSCSSKLSDSVNGGYSPLSDAHFCACQTHSMFVNHVGTPPTDGLIEMGIHLGLNYANAMYYSGYFFFGDGDPYKNLSYPLTSCDIIAHEIGHGYTDKTGNSKLEYRGESGGIDEAFSDMVGETVEYTVDNQNDFKIGHNVFKVPHLGLRDMCNPRIDGRSIDHYSQYQENMETHYSNGLYNKVFCILARDRGFGVLPTFKVFARANANYWNPTTNFRSGVCGVELAAVDQGFSKVAVTSAFSQVGLTCSQ